MEDLSDAGGDPFFAGIGIQLCGEFRGDVVGVGIEPFLVLGVSLAIMFHLTKEW